ncbi:MAG: ATP-dependent DNA helicase RecG [SAR86 cluster bacterium]|uniref:ATP-dependent DNA helicase RecG n=1 Tax=SAR86 cluster bacterium TaxID=2030880 RepID=A0A2A5B0Z7_9GAMM|nr:MAG: ATP-dependent DNA helicase RecG [SAR86 cluster bacterium]
MKNGQSLDRIPLTQLQGVGPALEKKLNVIGIFNVQDLLFHLPLRYEDRTRIASIASIHTGDTVQLQGEITSCDIQFGRRRSLKCTLRDNSGFISLRFFHFSNSQKNSLAPGTQILCYGEVKRGRSGYEIFHPEYKLLSELENMDELPVADSLTPVYPTTEGLQQTRLRNIAAQALAFLDDGNNVIQDYLPKELISQFGLYGLTDAIKLIHRPPIDAPLSWLTEGANPGQTRLAFEELLAHRLSMRRFKNDSNQQSAPRLGAASKLTAKFLQQLPFTLTNGQQTAYQEIADDLSKACPMLRLLQGDVGSGKTVVAALAALHALDENFQVALMAPTELLAEQHLSNFKQWLTPLGIQVGWLSGKIKGKQRKEQLENMANGSSQLTIGTHALFQDEVEYQRLGLIIIDEQHRFGVHQRLALREKAGSKQLNPHQLVMTATPIPRTLAMSAYADLDNSIIDELPPGRIPVNTVIISSERRPQVIERIEKACAGNNQAYWVCTLIEESEVLQCQAAEVTAEQLSLLLPNISVGLIHGRMKSKEKIEVMQSFKDGHLQLLVATTVIEVGVDVPNASLMVIENPERLGLAQLHQLRGRVGRGSISSHCILLYQTPLSKAGKQRLSVMRQSNDGFFIAEKDLELRGPGQVLGTQQTGLMSFRVADISRNSNLLDQVRDASEIVMANHPEIVDPLIHRWLGDRVNYANV